MRSLATITATSRSRRLRPAAPALGGASSMLRLSQPSGLRLPSGPALGGWVERAAAALRSFDNMVAVADDAPAALVTALHPSPALRGWAGLR